MATRTPLVLTQLSSVSVWCERFAVSFAAAALEPVAA
jgi:electron transfer DM13